MYSESGSESDSKSVKYFKRYIWEVAPDLAPVESLNDESLQKYFLEEFAKIVDQIVSQIKAERIDRVQARILFLFKVKTLINLIKEKPSDEQQFCNFATEAWLEARAKIDQDIAMN